MHGSRHKAIQLSKIRNFRTCIAVSVICVVLWNEYLSYTWSSLRWPTKFLGKRNDPEQVRILFVADPQLQGYHDAYLKFPAAASLAIFDADMYLHRGFSRALRHVEPDVVVFLGDLLDEGSQATDALYSQYAARFHHIFATPSHVQKIYISGDNDIGGETLSDPRENWKIQRFNKVFASNASTDVKFLDFFKGDLVWMGGLETKAETELKALAEKSRAVYHILLNHIPVVDSSNERAEISTCSKSLLEKYQTEQDQSKLPKWPTCMRSFKSITPADDVITFDLSDVENLHELKVPTCSYRMGVPNMGYGVAVIGKEGMAWYQVLWLPSRYHQLYTYVILILLLINVCVFRRLCLALGRR